MIEGRIIFDGIRLNVSDKNTAIDVVDTVGVSYPYGVGDYVFSTEADGVTTLADNTDYVCQVFKAPPIDEEFIKVRLKLYKATSPDGNVQTQIVNVNQTTEEPDETSVNVSSDSIAASTLTTNTAGAWVTFTLTSATTLTPNTLYGILLKRTSATVGTVNIRQQVLGNTRYIWKAWDSTDGSTWTAYNYRYLFIAYHTTTPLCRSMVTRLSIDEGAPRLSVIPILNRDGGKIQYGGRDNKRVEMDVLLQAPSTITQGVQLLFDRLDTLKTAATSYKIVVEGNQLYQLDIPVDSYFLEDWSITDKLAGTLMDVYRLHLRFLEDTN